MFIFLHLLLLWVAPSRADVLVLREGAPEPPRAAEVLLAAPDLVGAGPRPRLAALRPQRALAGALPAHAAGRPPTPRVSTATILQRFMDNRYIQINIYTSWGYKYIYTQWGVSRQFTVVPTVFIVFELCVNFLLVSITCFPTVA